MKLRKCDMCRRLTRRSCSVPVAFILERGRLTIERFDPSFTRKKVLAPRAQRGRLCETCWERVKQQRVLQGPQ